MQYPKINSLYKRQGWYFDEEAKKNPEKQAGRQTFIEGDYARKEFANISFWQVEEKIDGTNIRVNWDGRMVTFGGRTKDAQIPTHLLTYLQAQFTAELMDKAFSELKDPPFDITLYGEGYGPKINNGGFYDTDPKFCLFDVRVGRWWLEKHSLMQISETLGIKIAPTIGTMTTQEIVDYVKTKPISVFATNDRPPRHVMEGVMCRPVPQMLFRDGTPIMFKLKCKDFPSEDRKENAS